MSLRGRRQRRYAKANLIKALGVFGIILLVVIGGTIWWMSRSPGLDAESLCPNTGPAAHTVLLIDLTDPLNATQRAAVEVFIQSLVRDELKEGERVSIFAVGANVAANSRPIFDMCNPGSGREANPWTQNPDRLTKRFKTQFEKPLEDVLDDLLQASPASNSPILQMLQMVSINGFRKHNVKGARRLMIVSDMLQNSSEINQYRGIVDFKEFASSDAFLKLRTDLSGVTVQIQYILHRPDLQRRRHVQFWEDYFGAMGSRLTAVYPLEG